MPRNNDLNKFKVYYQRSIKDDVRLRHGFFSYQWTVISWFNRFHIVRGIKFWLYENNQPPYPVRLFYACQLMNIVNVKELKRLMIMSVHKQNNSIEDNFWNFQDSEHPQYNIFNSSVVLLNDDILANRMVSIIVSFLVIVFILLIVIFMFQLLRDYV